MVVMRPQDPDASQSASPRFVVRCTHDNISFLGAALLSPRLSYTWYISHSFLISRLPLVTMFTFHSVFVQFGFHHHS